MPSVFEQGDYVNSGKFYIHPSSLLGLADEQPARSLLFSERLHTDSVLKPGKGIYLGFKAEK